MNCNKNLLWNYIGYGSSLSINIFLLPIILQYLSGEELGLWYVFMSVGTFVTMVDFGFSPQIARFVTYAYAGADSLKKSGIVSAVHTEMNAELLLKLLIASRRLYLFLSLFVFILLITVGSYYVTVISKTLPYRQVLCSWIVFLESNQSLFVSYISTSNKLPYVFPYLISAISGVGLAIVLLEYTDWGIWGILIAHFVVQLCYNNWKWPCYAIKESNIKISNACELLY